MTNKNPSPSIEQLLQAIPEKLSTIKSKHHIPMEEQIGYIQYHNQINQADFKEKEVLKESKKLFEKNFPEADKRRILFLLAHFGTVASYKVLAQYLDKTDKKLLPWAVLCLEECRMFVESDLLEEDRGMIMGGAGGDGNRLRYYFVISTENDAPFTPAQKKIIKQEFEQVAQKINCKIEKIEFGKNYALFTALHDWETAPAELIEKGIETCNESQKFLRFNYYVGNMEKPNKKFIAEYLANLK